MRTSHPPKTPKFMLHMLMLALSALTLLGGCTIVMREPPPPSPLQGKSTFYLEELDFSGVEDPEKEHVEEITKMYMEEMKDEGDHFDFKDAPGEGVVVIRAKVSDLDKGVSLGLNSTDSSVQVKVVWLEGEQTLETRTFQASVDQGDSKKVFGVPTGGYSDTDRLKEATEKVVAQILNFMNSATRG